MQLVSFLILILITIGVTIWLGTKKDWHAILAVVPFAFFILGVLMLNTDPTIEIPLSSVSYVEGNGTWNAQVFNHTVVYDLDVTVLAIVNILTFCVGALIVLVGYERIQL